MILRVYRVNKELPECLIHNSLECNNIWDIDPGIYKRFDSIQVNCREVNEIIETLERDGLKDFTFEKSDIVEMLYDEEMMNNHETENLECNFLILTGLGWEQIDIDKDSVFRELSIKELYELFEMK